MTKERDVQKNFAHFASQMARNPHTFAELQEAMKDVERKQAIGDRIAALRERRGFTQPQVASRVPTQLRNYQNWEAGHGTSGENYERIAEILGCSYDYLVTGAEASPPREDILARLDQIEERVAEIAASVAELAATVGESQTSQGTPRKRAGQR